MTVHVYMKVTASKRTAEVTFVTAEHGSIESRVAAMVRALVQAMEEPAVTVQIDSRTQAMKEDDCGCGPAREVSPGLELPDPASAKS